MRGKNLINVWLTQQFDSGVHVYALVCLLAVDTLNILCDWNKPCDLLWMTSSLFVIKMFVIKIKSINFFAKSYIEQNCFVAVFWVLHFTRYETTILRCGGLYYYCLIYQVFLHICWKFDENTYTTTQIMTINARFLFFRSQLQTDGCYNYQWWSHLVNA